MAELTPFTLLHIGGSQTLEPRVWNDTVDYISDRLGEISAEIAALSAADIAFTPAGNIAATNVQAAIAELDTEKVAKAGDTMTGTLTVNTGNVVVSRNDGIPFVEAIGDGQTSSIQTTTYGASTFARFLSRRARGTASVPLVVSLNDVSGELLSQFHTGSDFVTAGSLFTRVVAATPGPSDLQARLELNLCPAASASASLCMRVSHAAGLELFGANIVIDADRVLRSRVFTVATLPANVAGKRALVSDANSPTFGNAVSGGGSTVVPVYNTGSAWNVG